MQSKPKILFLCKFIPAPAYNGGAIRNRAWLEFLAKKYDIILIGFINTTYLEKFLKEVDPFVYKKYCLPFKNGLIRKLLAIIKLILFLKPLVYSLYQQKDFSETIKNILGQEKVEFIFCSELAMYQYAQELPYPIHFDDHNVEFEIAKRRTKFSAWIIRPLFWLEYFTVKQTELSIINQVKTFFCVSSRDKKQLTATISKDQANKLKVVPNTYHEVNCPEALSKDPSIIFTGNLNWAPNYHGLKHFIENILKQIEKQHIKVKLIILGSSKNRQMLKLKKSASIEIIENATEFEKQKLLAQTWIGIVPIYFGGGTRIKILEYWAFQKPVISTEIGAEGLEKSTGTILVKNDQEFTDNIINLIRDQNKRKKAGHSNYLTFKQLYSYETIYEDSLYNTFSD